MVIVLTVFDETKKYTCTECNAVDTVTVEVVGGQRSRDVDTETTNFTCGACGVTVQREEVVSREVTLTVL